MRYTNRDTNNRNRLRSYSAIFSRSVFSEIINYSDYSRLEKMRSQYDFKKSNFCTYSDYIRYLYKELIKGYRCEYVYKNEIINKLLLKEYGTKNTIALNEFRVKKSIVDIAMFNGESKAFEIKTEYDTKQRLEKQLDDYAKIFQKCYIVIPKEHLSLYENSISNNVGIITLNVVRGRIKLTTIKEARSNNTIEINTFMSSIRTAEYKNIVEKYYGELPNVSSYEMFDSCKELIAKIPYESLNDIFLQEIKKRKNNTQILDESQKEIRQVCLSMNLTQSEITCLINRLQTPIIA